MCTHSLGYLLSFLVTVKDTEVCLAKAWCVGSAEVAHVRVARSGPSGALLGLGLLLLLEEEGEHEVLLHLAPRPRPRPRHHRHPGTGEQHRDDAHGRLPAADLGSPGPCP